jgi:acyl carrier protein
MSDFYSGIAEILEIEGGICASNFNLADGQADWDSLAIISVIALIDEIYGCTVSGQALGECQTVADIERLVENARL